MSGATGIALSTVSPFSGRVSADLHILDSRRKGKALPIGVPLNVKESFLKAVSTPLIQPIRPRMLVLCSFKKKKESKIYTRATIGTRDPGASSQKETPVLREELRVVDQELQKTEDACSETDSKLTDVTTAKEEFSGLAEYKKKHLAAVRDDVTTLRDALKTLPTTTPSVLPSSTTADQLLSSLEAEKRKLEQLRQELMRELDS
ncbi:hypothetical protein HDU76_007090 [Blyttiomyces sp. JEL0837]|nr:hypothetical protein HDU76_007090 [Blyttiomyces sp. JEL0837]